MNASGSSSLSSESQNQPGLHALHDGQSINLKLVSNPFPLLVCLSFVPSAFSCIAYLEDELTMYWIIMALLIYCITFIFMLVLRLMLSGFFCWNVIFWAQFRKMWAILLQAEKNIKSCRPNISQLSQEDNNGKLYETGGVDVATSPTLGSLVPQKNRIRVWFEYFIFTMVYGVPLIHYFIIFALTAYIAVAFFILPKNNAYDRSALGQMIFLLWLVIINPLVGFASHLLRVGDRNQAILQDTRRAAVSTRLDKLLRDLDRLSNLARENTEVAPTAGNRSKGGPEQGESSKDGAMHDAANWQRCSLRALSDIMCILCIMRDGTFESSDARIANPSPPESISTVTRAPNSNDANNNASNEISFANSLNQIIINP